MPSITPNRIRLTLDQKQKIIEDSKKPGFNKAKVLEQYGIGRSTLTKLLLNQKDVLGSIDKSGSAHKIKSVYRPPHYEIEKKTVSSVPCQT